ncbi:bleomycin resistance protein [Clostridium folliculivorans]|uniref:Bleomycin resistance protein n=1 Tax=Clostridium folliculivorans TaxID=2886038 RepID=A0A9W5Y0P1_9CLOT|nr:VOC family protein [Clostridium folliculivorans]GKU24478.1 aldoketomutase [Clostridium folliculivorans]GKU30576.1 aldoketomutase [Clostridium folliculivorans]
MEFNSLIPELSVTNIESTKQFYISMLGFKLEYERANEKFIFLSYGKSQFMFEEIHPGGWNIDVLEYPLGRGINFSIACTDIELLYEVVKNSKIKIYRDLKETIYLCDEKQKSQKEFLIQDPDGYLLRFTD